MMYQEKRSYEKNQYAQVCSRRTNSDELFAGYGASIKGEFHHAVRLLRRRRKTDSRKLHDKTAAGRPEYVRDSECNVNALGIIGLPRGYHSYRRYPSRL